MRYLKKVIAILLVVAVGFPHFWTFEIMATSSTQRELNEVNRQLRELENQRNEEFREYLNLREDLQNLRDEMLSLDMRIGETDMLIQETVEEIMEVVASIEVVVASLEHLESDIEVEERALNESREDLKAANEILSARVRAMHENGQVNIITVLLNSESITDFLMRFDDLRSVIRFNRDFLQNLTELEELYQSNVDRLKLSQARQEDLQFNLERRERELTTLLTSYEELYEDLLRQRDEKDDFIQQLLEDVERFELILDLLEAEYYALQRRLGNLHARFDRERAAAAFDHAYRHARASAPSVQPPAMAQPGVHTVPAAPTAAGGGFIVSNALWLMNLDVPDYVLEGAFREDLVNVLDSQETARRLQELGRYDIRVNPREDVLAWPVPTHPYISQGFSHTAYARHHGLDIGTTAGEAIVAAADGRVVYSEWTIGAGNMVIIEHDNGLKTVYAHNSRNHVSVGDVVSRGQHIADVGATGSTRLQHLHFEVLQDGIPVDPMQFFR